MATNHFKEAAKAEKARELAAREAAKAWRDGMKSCHGNWWTHESAQAHGLICTKGES